MEIILIFSSLTFFYGCIEQHNLISRTKQMSQFAQRALILQNNLTNTQQISAK